MFYWVSLILSFLTISSICVAVGRDDVESLKIRLEEYPQIVVYAEGSSIIYNKKPNGVEEYRFKDAAKIQNLNLSCTSSSPVEWIFECPEDTVSHISNTKEVWFDPVSRNYLYRTNVTFPQERSQLGFDRNPENVVNVTCRNVENPGVNKSVIFFNHKPNFKVRTRNNFVFNKTGNCPKNNHLCPVEIIVDLKTATFECYALNKTRLKIQTKTIACHDKMDYCKSLAMASSRCVNFTRSHTLSNLFPSLSYKIGIVQCVTSVENYITALYYAVLGESSNPRVLNKAEDVLELKDKVLVLTSESEPEDLLYVENQFAVFICKAYTSVFAMGTTISYVHKNHSIIPLENLEKETIKNWNNFSVYVKRVNVTINKNMTAIICNAPVAYSRQWKHTQLSINVTDGEKPKIVNYEFFSNDSLTSTYKCEATGRPAPNITWLNRTVADVAVNGISRGRIKPPTTGNSTYRSSTIILNTTSVSSSTIICKAKNFIDHVEVEVGVIKSFGWTVFVLSVVIVVTLLGLSVVGFLLFRRWSQRGVLLSEDDCDEFYKGNRFLDQSDPLSGALLLAYDINFEVPRRDITMDSVVLGSGQFGIVIQGRYQGTTVAVKTIRHTTDIKYFKALLAELKILQYLGHHPNIVNLVGACTTNIRKMEVLLLLDYCENGNLVKFLRSCRSTFLDLYHHKGDDITRVPVYENNCVMSITTKDLVRFSLQVMDACVFIADKKILHGDLACRNVLVSTDKNVKICDFGLAKQLFQYSLYIQKDECPLPLRWMALESLQDMEFSIQSDVWSAGVLLWEIFSLAEIPYPGMDWSFESWRMLKDGYRMDKPEYCNKSMHQLMLECWKNDPQLRPTFSYLAKAFRNELDSLR